MPSQTDICNMAILPLGGQAINAIDETSKEAMLCSQFWDIRLQEVLGDHTWNFAKKWVALSEISDYDFVDSAYAYAYQLPADYIRFSASESDDLIYERREDVLLCNESDLIIEYIKLVEDSAKFPTHFVAALVARLQADLAIPLSKRGSKTIDYLANYQSVVLPWARTKDAQENSPGRGVRKEHTDANDTWLAARGIVSTTTLSSLE